MEWLGHDVRMDGKMTVKNLLKGTLQKSFINVSHSMTKTVN